HPVHPSRCGRPWLLAHRSRSCPPRHSFRRRRPRHRSRPRARRCRRAQNRPRCRPWLNRRLRPFRRSRGDSHPSARPVVRNQPPRASARTRPRTRSHVTASCRRRIISTRLPAGNQSRVYLGTGSLCAEAAVALVGASLLAEAALFALLTALGARVALFTLAAFAVAISGAAEAEAEGVATTLMGAAASSFRVAESAMGFTALAFSSLLGASAGAWERSATVPAIAVPASAAAPRPTHMRRLGRRALPLSVLLRSNPVPGAVRATMVSALEPAGASGTKRVTLPVESAPCGVPG